MMEKAREVAKAQAAWVAARQGNDFDLFAKAFAALMPLNREIAAAKAQALSLAPYDALMDEADPGLTTAIVDPIFDDLASSLPTLLAEGGRAARPHWPAPIPFRRRLLSRAPAGPVVQAGEHSGP